LINPDQSLLEARQYAGSFYLRGKCRILLISKERRLEECPCCPFIPCREVLSGIASAIAGMDFYQKPFNSKKAIISSVKNAAKKDEGELICLEKDLVIGWRFEGRLMSEEERLMSVDVIVG